MELDSRDARFKTVRGLANPTVYRCYLPTSAITTCGIRASRIILSPYSNDATFKKDATFCMEWGLRRVGNEPSVTFRSFNYPERVIRHRNSELWLDPVENTPLFRTDASFFIEPVARRRCASTTTPGNPLTSYGGSPHFLAKGSVLR